MKRLVEFFLENGSSIFVEVEEPETDGGVVKVSRSNKDVDKATQTFESSLEKIKPMALTVISKLRSLHDSPDEVEVEFGLKLNAEVGAVIASSSIEANYKVILRWNKNKKTDGKNKSLR